MAGSASAVKISYLGDASSLARASKQAQGDLDGIGKKASGSSKAVGLALGGAAVIVGKFAKDSISAFTEAQQSSARLDDALARFPATADKSRASFDALNSSLAKKTRFDDDATASGQAVLAQYKLTGTQIQQLTPLLQDYAAKTGRDIPAAAEVLGKALLGKGKALADVGIKFKDAGSTGANFEQVVGNLRTKVGGFAEKEGKTAAGQAEILKNQFGNVQETVGSKLVPALTTLTEKLLSMIGFVQRTFEVIGPLVTVTGTFAATVFLVNKAMAAQVGITAAATAVKALFTGATVAQTGATGAAAAAQTGLNTAMIANPIGLVIAAVAALAAGMVYAYKHSETFRDIIDGAFKAVSAAASFMWDNVLKPVFKFVVDAWLLVAGTIVHGAASAFGWVPGVGGKLKEAAKAFDKFRDDVNKALDGIQSQKTIHLTATGLVSLQNRHELDARAGGGPVSAGKPYLVGETEAELFVPGTSGRILNQRQMASELGGGQSGVSSSRGGVVNNITINVTSNVQSVRDFADELRTELLQASRRLGGLGLA